MDSRSRYQPTILGQIQLILFALVMFGAFAYWAATLYWFLREGADGIGTGVRALDWIGWSSTKPTDWIGAWLIATAVTSVVGPAGLLLLPILLLHLIRRGLGED